MRYNRAKVSILLTLIALIASMTPTARISSLALAATTETIKSENFETGFPENDSRWSVTEDSWNGLNATWGATDYPTVNGNRKAWPVAGGPDARDPHQANYPDLQIPALWDFPWKTGVLLPH